MNMNATCVLDLMFVAILVAAGVGCVMEIFK